MRAKILTLWSAPYLGGAARRFAELVDGLWSRGMDLVVLSTHDYPGLPDVPVEDIVLPQGRFRTVRTRVSGRHSWHVDSVVEEYKPDVVFAFGLANGATLFPPARLRDIPCVLFIRGMELAPKEYRCVPFGRIPLLGIATDALYAWAFGVYARGIFRTSDTVVFQNEAQYHAYLDHEYFCPRPGCSVRFLPNNSNPSWMSERQPHSPVGSPVTVVAANLYWGKGFRIALDAFSVVRQHVSDARLVILGDGPEGKAIRRYASGIPGVSFCGHVKNIHNYLEHARLLVHPTLFELGSPNIVLEAAGWGLPMLVSDEVVHTTGAKPWVYPAHDHESLAKVWTEALTDTEFYARLCNDSRQLGERYRFDWVAEAGRILVSPSNEDNGRGHPSEFSGDRVSRP